MATRVASQLASAARKTHPGDGAWPSPPTDLGMSVASASPPGPSTRIRRPSTIVAVAAESVYLASSGCSVRYFVAASIEERIRSLVMPRLLTLIAPVAEPIAVWKPRSLGVVSLRGRFVDHVSGNV